MLRFILCRTRIEAKERTFVVKYPRWWLAVYIPVILAEIYFLLFFLSTVHFFDIAAIPFWFAQTIFRYYRRTFYQFENEAQFRDLGVVAVIVFVLLISDVMSLFRIFQTVTVHCDRKTVYRKTLFKTWKYGVGELYLRNEIGPFPHMVLTLNPSGGQDLFGRKICRIYERSPGYWELCRFLERYSIKK